MLPPADSAPCQPAPFSARTELLIGADGYARLQTAHILVAGLGGVGGHATEALARAGIGHLTLADHDRVEPTNLNRQLIALRSTLGRPKVQVAAERIQDINPACQIRLIDEFLTPETIPELIGGGFDAVVDAIDSIDSKVALLIAALDARIPIFSSMGAGGRLDPGAIRISDLMETRICPLARSVRQRLRRQGYSVGVTAVWSDETALPSQVIHPDQPRTVKGTISYLPALFGLTLAGCALQQLLGKPTQARVGQRE